MDKEANVFDGDKAHTALGEKQRKETKIEDLEEEKLLMDITLNFNNAVMARL